MSLRKLLLQLTNDSFRYRAILDTILSSSGEELADNLKVFIEASKFLAYLIKKKTLRFVLRYLHSVFLAVVNENVSLVISRQVLTDVSARLLLLPDETSKAVSHYTLDKVTKSLSFYECEILLHFFHLY